MALSRRDADGVRRHAPDIATPSWLRIAVGGPPVDGPRGTFILCLAWLANIFVQPIKCHVMAKSPTRTASKNKRSLPTVSQLDARLTTNQGTVIFDDQNFLKNDDRGPSLLEDFIPRAMIPHFDHERIVQARGSGAHGDFQADKSLADITKAAFLQSPKEKTPVFVRFSTVTGGTGSIDTARDERGFALKSYTSEGNFDVVDNNIPVFFIKDAMKFPDLIHSLKMELDRRFPRATSAHDTFWDFVSLMPEGMHKQRYMSGAFAFEPGKVTRSAIRPACWITSASFVQTW